MKLTREIMNQMDKAAEYVARNKDRLIKQFGDKIIAVDYRDVRGGIVVDSDYDLIRLLERNNKYQFLIGTIEEIINGPIEIDDETSEIEVKLAEAEA